MRHLLRATTVCLIVLFSGAACPVSASPVWSVQTIPEEVSGTSLAYSPAGHPSVVFTRTASGGIAFGQFDGVQWQVSTPVTTPHAYAYDLLFGTDGHPMFLYEVSSTASLHLARFNGTVWTSQTIADGSAHNASLAIAPDGHPAVAYSSSEGFTERYIKYAKFDGTNWNITTVEEVDTIRSLPSLAFGPDGEPAVLFYSRLDEAYKLARRNAGTWSSSVVWPMSEASHFYPTCDLAFAPDGRPAVVLEDEATAELVFTRHNGTSWVATTLDSGVGLGLNLVFHAQGRETVTYNVLGPTARLKVARFDGSSWTYHHPDPAEDVGYGSDQAFGPNNDYGVAYRESNTNIMRFAQARLEMEVFDGLGVSGARLNGSASGITFPSTPSKEAHTLSFTVRNNAFDALGSLSVQVVGTGASAFVVGPPQATTLASGETTSFFVTFAPNSPGAYSANLQVTATGVPNSPVIIALQGTATIPSGGGDAYGVGGNNFGALGDGTTVYRISPVRALKTGALAGKRLKSIAGGSGFTVALGTEGEVFAWGINDVGQLGDATQNSSTEPVATLMSGGLAGRTVTAISTGGAGHSLALTQDRKVFAWGGGGQGQLGTGDYLFRTSPTAVDTSGVMAGVTVVKVVAGDSNSFAISADGRVFSWGYNLGGETGEPGTLGDGTPTPFRPTPVEVDRTGALAGKVVVSVSASATHTLALASDGSLFAWGENVDGQFGNGSTVSSTSPVAIALTGSLAGKTITAISANWGYSLALASDGTVHAWGDNGGGQLGNGTTTDSHVPVAVDQSGELAGKNPVEVRAGYGRAHLRCSDGSLYGWGTAMVGDGTEEQRFRPRAVDSGGVLGGKSAFALAQGQYDTHFLATGISPDEPDIEVAGVGGLEYRSGSFLSFGTTGPGAPVSRVLEIRNVGTSNLSDLAASISGLTTAGFSITVAPASSLAPGEVTTLTIGFDPTMEGTVSATLELHSNDPEEDPFLIRISGNGLSPSPRDFFGWGEGGSGRLGYGGEDNRHVPGPVDQSGALFGASIAEVDGGDYHSLALTTDGRLFSWGSNIYGQLGDGTTTASPVATRVATHLKLLGESVTAISAGGSTSAALTASGRIFTWGRNDYGTLGNGSLVFPASVPGPVLTDGPLNGKTVTSISMGENHALVVTQDGLVCGWGLNNAGQLGTGVVGPSEPAPVAILASGALAGKTIVAVRAAPDRSMALDTDGKVYAWGSNFEGALGDGTYTDRAEPTAVDVTGILSGKTVIAIASGYAHSLALTSDGLLVAWGNNSFGQLGNGTNVSSPHPVAVDMSGALQGKTVVAIRAKGSHNLALTSDGLVFAWGANYAGQLGDGTLLARSSPVPVDPIGHLSHRQVVGIGIGSNHTFAITAANPVPLIVQPSATGIGLDEAYLEARVEGDGGSPIIGRGFVISPTSANPLPSIGGAHVTHFAAGSGLGSFASTAALLLPNTSYTFRAYGTNQSGVTGYSTAVEFTTTTNPLETWRQTHFPGSTATTGPGADNASPEGDGIPNLMKFALGMDPDLPGVLPIAFDAGLEVITFTYTPSPDAVAAGIQFRVQFSTTLVGGDWSDEGINQGDIGEGGQPVTAIRFKPESGNGFMRLTVTNPGAGGS